MKSLCVIRLKDSYNSFLASIRKRSNWLYRFLIYCNLVLRHWNLREHKKRFGDENPDKTFFVVRADDNCSEGLLSLYINRGSLVYKAIEKGYIPVVDFKNYKTMYNMPEFPDENAWDYYFLQPYSFSLEEVYKSKNVILSGWSFSKNPTNPAYNICGKEWLVDKNLDEISSFFLDRIDVRPEIKEFANREYEKLFPAKKRVLGVFFRGTTYVQYRPYNHPIQPDIKQMFEKVDRFLLSYGIENIFLATEDADIIEEFKQRYKSIVITYNGNNTVSKSLTKNGLANIIHSGGKTNYQIGLGYLITMLILSQCDYLVSSIANGSIFANIMNGNRYEDKYIFNLGVYD